MGIRDPLRPPRQVLATFLAVAALSTGALGWLTWGVQVQDQQLEAQGQRVELEEAADAATGSIQQGFASLGVLASRPVDQASSVPFGVSWVTLREGVGTAIRPHSLP